MEEWKEYKATDFCANVTDGTHDSPKPKIEGHYLITSKHLQNNVIDFSSAYRISEEDYQKVIQRSQVEQFDILFSMIGTIGNTVRVVSPEVDFAVKNMAIFKMGRNDLKSKWLYYWLKASAAKAYISSRLAGSTQSYLTLDALRNFPIYAPDERTMQGITDILSSIDDKIELNNRINHNLEEQAQALYKSWFVDFEPFKDGEFVDSEHGLIPEGWRVGTISELISDTYNGDWGKEESTGAFTKRVFCIRGADIPSIRVGNSGKMPTRFIQEKHFLSKYLKNDDLVIEISGGSPTQSTGRFCRITEDLIERYNHSLICTNFCKAIRPSDGCSLFLSYLWNDLYEKGTMFSYENGTTGIKNLDLSGLIGGEPVIIPDKRSMRLFSIAVSALNKQILFNGHENEKLGEQRDLMLPKLMSGEMLSNKNVC